MNLEPGRFDGDNPPPTYEQYPPTPPPRSGVSTGTLLLGGVLIVVGVLWLLQRADIIASPWRAALPGVLIAVGVAILIEARRRLDGGLVTIGVLLTLILSITSIADIPIGGGVGDRDHRPTSMAEVNSPYKLSVGEQILDFSAVDFPEGETVIEAKQGVGDLTIIVPRDIGMKIDWRVGVGEADIFDQEQSGVGNDGVVTRNEDNSRQLRINASVGLGQLEVRDVR
ncbi:MAG: cell wall-active antibiotics response protein [Thermomicrobiales bacterium]|nr:cell wall-active antibiotics response protein [Thermomicrobiales bacterium]